MLQMKYQVTNPGVIRPSSIHPSAGLSQPCLYECQYICHGVPLMCIVMGLNTPATNMACTNAGLATVD